MLWSSGNIMQQGGSLVVLLPLCQSRILYNQEKVHTTVIIKWYLCDSVLSQRDFVFFSFFFWFVTVCLASVKQLVSPWSSPVLSLLYFVSLYFPACCSAQRKRSFAGKYAEKRRQKKREKKGFLRFKQIRGNVDHVIYRLHFDL